MRYEDGEYKRVLHKLKAIMMNGLFSSDGIFYEYEWDETKKREDNLYDANNEHNVVGYLIGINVVDGRQGRNEYRHQQFTSNIVDNSLGVWADWDKSSVSMREFDQETVIYSIDVEKFEEQLAKLNLQDNGIELVDRITPVPLSPVLEGFGKFTAHKNGSIQYDKKTINLKPQEQRLLHALILKKGKPMPRYEIIDVIWHDDEDADRSYLDDPKHTKKVITKSIGNIVSSTNSVLRGYTGKKSVKSNGRTSYMLIA